MKITTKVASLSSIAVLITACGGSNVDAPAKSAPQAMRSGAIAPPSTLYANVVQSLYMGFFGRPADAQGFIFWTNHFAKMKLPHSFSELLVRYPSDADIRTVVDAFADSAESKELYVANNASFINAVYLNAFNRNAEAPGRQFWSGFVDRGELSRAQVVLRILTAGQGDDAVVEQKKVAAAILLTARLAPLNNGYDGDPINQAARALLGEITATTDLDAFSAKIDAFVASLSASDTPFPAVSRYVGYHYQQDMTNTPTYAAHYSYSVGGFAGPANNGTLTYGETPQTVTWTRESPARVLIHGAPVIATSSLPATGFLPTITMLCTPIQGANGSVVKSTDVLVSRSATQLFDASKLAGQTLSVYREDCATGGSHVQSFVFDAAGSGTFTSASGSLTFDARSVTAAMNGQVLLDLSTGKYLVFSAYRYTRLDGTLGYAIVQHLGNHLTGVTDGVIAVWSQE